VTIPADLVSRLAEGHRPTDDDIAVLAASYDIIALGMLADEARQRRHGARTTFVRVADVPVSGTEVAWPATTGEIRIVGTPATRAAAVERVGEVAALAKKTPVSGFTLSDLEHMAAADGATLRALLEELSAAGLEMVADAAFDLLKDPRRAIEQVNISGLALARLTIHQLPSPDVPALYTQVADLQRWTAVVRAFAPLPRRVNPAVPTTGYDDVKRVALARLIVDNISSIQVDWLLYGPKLAQVALTVGADDIDAVSAADDSSQGPRRAPLEEIRRNIRAASQEPVERNGRFDVLETVIDPAGTPRAAV
jgi:aminodeoxyfutalosine synthase